MATTVNSDLVIYNDTAQTAYLERNMDNLAVFNENSRAAIGLNSELIEGDLKLRSFYKVGGAISDRDVNSVATVSGTKIAADEMVSVKVPWKYGPYETTEEAFKRRARSPEEFSMLLGQDMADATMAGWIGYALNALQGAIGSNAGMNVSGELATEGKKVLTKGLRTMGDKASSIAIWVMDSTSYFDIVDEAIDNKLYEEAGVVVYGGTPGTLGKPVLVTDQCQATKIFGLVAGAVMVTESQAPGMRSYQIDDQENLAIGFRAEGTANVEVLGYKWKTKTNVNPASATLATTTNWEKYATDDKATAGFIITLTTTP
ncbi:major capsid protein [Vibrio phage P23]|nr:major capsid protein [Vibrio phage P23]